MGIIRLLLALSVVAVHCGTIWKFDFVGGQVSVQSFYIISGFYMTMVLNEKYINENSSYKLFITNRMLRLYPIYWVVVLLTILTCTVLFCLSDGMLPTTLTNYSHININVLPLIGLIISNVVIFGQDMIMFLGIDTNTGNLFWTKNFAESPVRLHGFLFIQQSWTLALELMFYLIAPLILRRGWKVVAILIISSCALRLVLYNYFKLTNDPWTYRFFPTELMFFLLGYFSYRIYLKVKNAPASNLVGLLSLLLIMGSTVVYFFIPQIKINFSPFSLNEIFYFTLISFSIPFLFITFKRSRLDNKIGELSYPVYISHLLVYTICMNLPFVQLRTGLSIALLTILFSIVLNKLIADPVEKFRQSRLSKKGKEINPQLAFIAN